MPSEVPEPEQVTRLLRQLGAGDPAAGDELLPLVYAGLRDLAQNLMRGERANHTLQPTALVHEAWLRLLDQPLVGAPDRSRFRQVAARAMRQVLVDHARERNARKRGGGYRRVALDSILESCEQGGVDLLALDEALEALTARDAELARLVELRFFAGLTLAETAEALGLSVPQVRWSWGLARGWLHRALRSEGNGAGDD